MTTKQMVYSAMFMGIIFISTYFIQIQTSAGMGGLVHVGTVALFSISLKYGKKYGAISAGIGMAMFDILSAWFIWAPATFVIRIIMGYVVGWIAEDENGQGTNLTKNIIAILVGAAVMLPGYFIFQAFILGGESGGVAAAVTGIPGNITQIVIGLVALLIIKQLPDLKEEDVL